MTTTTTDVQVSNAETGEVFPSQVLAEVARLDGAATDDRWLPTPRQIPDHPERTRASRRPHHDTPARDYATLIGQTRITPNRAAIRDVLAHQEVATDHLHHQAVDWKDLAFWAETEQRQVVSEISDEYWSGRSEVQLRYESELERLKAGLDHASYGAYVAAVGDYVSGDTATVQTQQHDSVYAELAPPRIAEPECVQSDTPPDDRVQRMTEDPERYFAEARERAEEEVAEWSDRADVEAMTEGRRHRDALAASQPQTPPQTPADEAPREPWWMRVLRWIGGAA